MNDQRLDGWKAIGNFLGRDRTTALRWAKERGLPVHRVPGGRTGTVYALRAELDAWLESERVAPNTALQRVSAEEVANAVPTQPDALRLTKLILAAFTLGAVIAAGWLYVTARDPSKAPVSIAAVASPAANAETTAFARALTTDLARFANASTSLAVFEREPGEKPDTQYAIRTEIERAGGSIVANARLIAVQNGEVLWSRRFDQSQQALSTLREQVAANIVGLLQCSFGTLGSEQVKARPADVAMLMAICDDFGNRDFPSAQTRARQLTVARPDLAVGWAWLAVVQGNMLEENDPALRIQALANAARAKEIGPDKACTWLAQAAVAGRGFTSPDALPFIERGLQTHPDHVYLLAQRSLILFNLGYVQASVAPALDTIRNDMSSLGGRDVAVQRLAAAGRAQEAAQLQAENERLWPDHPAAAATRERLMANVAAPRIADRDTIRENERDVLTQPHLAFALARLHERFGDRRAALRWLARAPIKDAHQQWSLLFWPDARGLRTEPAFFQKMADLGLVRWWAARGTWPDFCAEPGLKYDCATQAAKLGFKGLSGT